jgi:hypothetical protein
MVSSRFLLCILSIALTAATFIGCQRKNIDTPEAVRESIVKHIEARGDIDLKELELSVKNVSFQGNTCQAEVSFVPVGQPATSGMTMHYSLEREGDAWKVKPPKPPSGGMQTPPPTATPQVPPSQQPLPAGHPPVPSQSTNP